MEQSGTICEGEWASLSEMYDTSEEFEFMTQLLGEFSPSTVLDGGCLGLFGVQSNLFSGPKSANAASKDNSDYFVHSSDFSSQETSTYSGSNGDGDTTKFMLSSSHGAYYQLEDSNQCFLTDEISCYYSSGDYGFQREENVNSTAFICTDLVKQVDEDSTRPRSCTKTEAEYENVYHQRTKYEIQSLDDGVKEKCTSLPADSKKRVHRAEASRNKRNVKPRRGKKVAEMDNIEEDKSKQASSSNCSKEDASGDVSNLTLEEDTAPSSRNGKARANRGSATDPQSLYARKRREKINERLRILQGLVPNGTKVDISTMLDEAVQYVKFLQLQIKLLSSDDMWMYAPLAYNGMELGLDIEI